MRACVDTSATYFLKLICIRRSRKERGYCCYTILSFSLSIVQSDRYKYGVDLVSRLVPPFMTGSASGNCRSCTDSEKRTAIHESQTNLQQTNSEGSKLPLRCCNRPPIANFPTHAQPHYQALSNLPIWYMAHILTLCCILHIKEESFSESGAKQFNKDNAIVPSVVLYNQALQSRDGLGCLPLASCRATRSKSVHFPA